MEDLTIDVHAAIPHTSLTQNMDALNIDSPPSYGLLSNSISVNANLSNVVSNVDFNGASPSDDFHGASPSAIETRMGCFVCLLQVGFCASGWSSPTSICVRSAMAPVTYPGIVSFTASTYRPKIKLSDKTTGQRLNKALNAFHRLYQSQFFSVVFPTSGRQKRYCSPAPTRTLKLTYLQEK